MVLVPKPGVLLTHQEQISELHLMMSSQNTLVTVNAKRNNNESNVVTPPGEQLKRLNV
jgi:hypothetical protein